MKHITITIPTRNRYDKLMRCLESIPVRKDVSVIVCCDADPETFEKISELDNITAMFSLENIGAPACINLMADRVKDGLIYLMDDMELYPESIDYALEEYNQFFPKDDGMMGILQDLIDGGKSGVGLIGKKFLKRYPDKKLFYPGYWHFADMEVLALAEKLDKFQMATKTTVKHYHPDSLTCKPDQTFYDARVKKGEDFRLFSQRQKAGMIYGLTD